VIKKYLFIFGLIFFSTFLMTSEAAPEVEQEIVEFLKPKLNSDRIQYFFGSYGVDKLDIDSPVFPNSRIASLHSIHQGKKIMRTLAIVDFFQPVDDELNSVHSEIIEGKSIGIALREQGWMIQKKPLYFGIFLLSPALMDWMETSIDNAAVHAYRLEVSKSDQPDSIPYCTIIELHNPHYLSEEWLQALYDDQYREFSKISIEAEVLLSRLSVLIREFPSQTQASPSLQPGSHRNRHE
jgi:hypothetical protein